MMTPTISKIPSSFRDPDGYVFSYEGIVYRQIAPSYKTDYEQLMNSGLYASLVQKGLLVAHEDVTLERVKSIPYVLAHKIICPQQLSFISYPSTWSFGMLKDAALLTLKTQKLALQHKMILKDASAYNVQFVGSIPIFIDTLSFTAYTEGSAWAGYRQFCQHFLAPLALMAHTDVSLNNLFITHLEGIPLPLAAKLLPFKTRFNVHLFLHIHLHARTQINYQNKKINTSSGRMSSQKILNIVESLISAIEKLNWTNKKTEWADYYDTSVSANYRSNKSQAVKDCLRDINPQRVLDLGANDGVFSRFAAEMGAEVFSFDVDPACVEANYQQLTKEKNTKITPLVVDVTNPEPSFGWNNTERPRLFDRLKVDTIMALALIHHLRISNNTPLSKIAEFFSFYCQHLIIEFVPKSDDKVQRLLQNRMDIFDDYTVDGFKSAFRDYFTIEKTINFEDNNRILFLMKKVITN
jgi:SAM-dependent methyltransferase